MQMTRRTFLGCAAGAMTIALPVEVWRVRRSVGTVLLDLKEHTSLPEAVAGYQSALTSFGTRFARAEAQIVPRCSMLIVPAALEIPRDALQAIVNCLASGATVIIESGAGFAAEPEFLIHRAALHDCLQIHIEAPVHLWRDSRSQRIPYVDYTWPSSAKIRDFTRVVPLAHQAGEMIGWVGGLPVALKRQHGRGTLIFLGSPLGPALWAGDAEARRWLATFVATRAPLPPPAADPRPQATTQ